jgi:hypothetical protein
MGIDGQHAFALPQPFFDLVGSCISTASVGRGQYIIAQYMRQVANLPHGPLLVATFRQATSRYRML